MTVYTCTTIDGQVLSHNEYLMPCDTCYICAYNILFQGSAILNEQEQVANFEKSGHSIAKLDQHLQLKVFLHTMLAVERSEGG